MQDSGARFFRGLALLFSLFAAISAIGQNIGPLPLLPAPADPLEVVNGGIVVPATQEQRLAAQQIIVKARDLYKLHAGGPFDLKATFNATGHTRYEGPGTLEELFLGMNGSRWSAQIGSYSQTRVTGTMGLIYDDKPDGPIPLRLQQLRQAVFSPIYANPQTEVIRTAAAMLNGDSLNCVLLTQGSAEPATLQHRRWAETEWCASAQSGLLRIASEVPGAYTVYDYTDAISFHGFTLPRTITVSEAGAKVLDIRIESVRDPPSTDRAQVTATPTMKPGPALRDAIHLFPAVPEASGKRVTVVRPVVVHATFGADGRAIETEIAQSSSPYLNGTALDFVKHFAFRVPPPAGTIPEQSQAFVTVRFLSDQ